jgi:hypothetical protein
MNEFELFEKKLRSLPQSPAPVDLLPKLLAEIPEFRRVVQRARPHRNRTAMIIATAAALLVAATLAVWNRSPAVVEERAVSASYVVYPTNSKQETDPCAIMPPLADLRSP